jgi:homoisocitrate dehydrogenase
MPTICLIPGDGVGQEVIPAAARVLAAVAPDLEFVEAEAGWSCFERHGTALPDATLAAVAAADGTLFGATQSPNEVIPGYRSPILALRRYFDLYANLRPILANVPGTLSHALANLQRKDDLADRSEVPGRWMDSALANVPGTLSHGLINLQRPDHLQDGLEVPGTGIDMLIVRENTEGLYAGRERRDGDTAIAERVITRRASERIARVAFEQARHRAASHKSFQDPTNLPIYQPTVTIVHKANVLKLTDGLFREACLDVAKEYPDVTANELLVDAAAMWLVKEPTRFDVIVTTNLFGDILSDLAAGLVGGLGVAPSANIGAGRVAVFEPVHGSAPDIAGQGIANPVGAILSAAMLLEHIGRPDAANRVRQAVTATLADGIMTADLGGTATTELVTKAVIRHCSLAERPE